MNALPNKLTGHGIWSNTNFTVSVIVIGAIALTIPAFRRMVIKTVLSKVVNAGSDSIDQLATKGGLTS